MLNHPLPQVVLTQIKENYYVKLHAYQIQGSGLL